LAATIRKNLGLYTGPEYIKDKSAVGLGELMIDVRETFKEPLTEEKYENFSSFSVYSTSLLRIKSL